MDLENKTRNVGGQTGEGICVFSQVRGRAPEKTQESSTTAALAGGGGGYVAGGGGEQAGFGGDALLWLSGGRRRAGKEGAGVRNVPKPPSLLTPTARSGVPRPPRGASLLRRTPYPPGDPCSVWWLITAKGHSSKSAKDRGAWGRARGSSVQRAPGTTDSASPTREDV